MSINIISAKPIVQSVTLVKELSELAYRNEVTITQGAYGLIHVEFSPNDFIRMHSMNFSETLYHFIEKGFIISSPLFS